MRAQRTPGVNVRSANEAARPGKERKVVRDDWQRRSSSVSTSKKRAVESAPA